MSGLICCVFLGLVFGLFTGYLSVFSEGKQFIDTIYPGTKWCGPGDIAESYDDLGPKRYTDACCRTHDNCPDYILAGKSKYNLTNNAFYTRLHCRCDDAFKYCLKRAERKEQSTSLTVGQLYFNTLGTKCYKEAYPVVGCKKYRDPEPIEVFEKKIMPGTRRCIEYEFNRAAPRKWQWFDVTWFE